MDFDDVRPKAPAAAMVIGQDLSGLSIGELEGRIVLLKAEIERVEAELKAKRAHEAAAQALFRS